MFPLLSHSHSTLQAPARSSLSFKLKHRVSCLIFLTLTAGYFVVEGRRSTTLQHSQVMLLPKYQCNVTLGNLCMLMGNAT